MNLRQLNILRDLAAGPRFISSHKIADKYGVSRKTVYTDLTVINDAIALFDIKIEKRPRMGIKLSVTDRQKPQLKAFIEKLQKKHIVLDQLQRQLQIIKELICGSGCINILDWSLLYFISEATVRRDCEKVDALMAEDQLELVKEHGCIYLRGKEENIRKFLRNYIIASFSIDEQNLIHNKDLIFFFSVSAIKKIIKITEKCERSYQFKIVRQYKSYLILDLLISVHRYKLGHFVITGDSLLDSKELQQFEVYLFSGELLSQALGSPISAIADGEIKNIAYSLLAVGYEINRLVENSEIKATVQQFIQKVSLLIGLDLTKDEHLLNMLLSHIYPMVFRLRHKVMLSNQTTEEIKKQYSVLYNLVWLAAKTLADQFDLEFTATEIAFLTIHFEIAAEKLTKPLLIYVICPHGLAMSELIMGQLSRVFSDYDNLVKLEWKNVNSETLAAADLIISSIDLEEMPDNYIKVSHIITDKEMDHIREQYARLTKGRRKNFSAFSNNRLSVRLMLERLLDNQVLLRKNCRSPEECITFLADHSLAQNRENPLYLQSILDREKLGSTSLYTGAALPHADPQHVCESQLVMMTLQKPVSWGGNLVKVVMLIAVAEKDETFCKEALISLYDKISDPDYIEMLWLAKDRQSFINQLLSEVSADDG